MPRIATLLLTTLLAATAWAHDYTLGELKVGHPWARPTVAGQPTGGGYLKIENAGRGADRLLGARSDAAASLELHVMSMEGDVMKMRQIESIEIPAGSIVELKPGGLHLMLVGLKAPLTPGAKVPLTLTFEKAGELKVELWVEDAAAAGAAAVHKH